VLDLLLGQDAGLDLLPDIRDSSGNSIPVIVFSGRDRDVHCDERIDVLSKMNSPLASLGQAVRERLGLTLQQPVREIA